MRTLNFLSDNSNSPFQNVSKNFLFFQRHKASNMVLNKQLYCQSHGRNRKNEKY